MLTNTKKKNNWKYLFAIPVLLTCTFVFAKSNPSGQRVRLENVTTYNGHRFYWEKSRVDSIQVMDPTTRETTWVVTKLTGGIYKMDNDLVHAQEEPGIRKAQFKYENKDFNEYVTSKFKSRFPRLPDSIKIIRITNVVINETGAITYYDIHCVTGENIYDMTLAGSPFATYGKAIEKIVDESPQWSPAMSNGANIKVALPSTFNIYFKP
jgi:hypothetical protein